MYTPMGWNPADYIASTSVGVTPPGGATDHGDDGETLGRRRVGVPLSSGGNIIRGVPPHWGVHKEASDDYRVKDGLPPHT